MSRSYWEPLSVAGHLLLLAVVWALLATPLALAGADGGAVAGVAALLLFAYLAVGYFLHPWILSDRRSFTRELITPGWPYSNRYRFHRQYQGIPSHEWASRAARRLRLRTELVQVLCLLVIALIALLISTHATHSVVDSVTRNEFSPSDSTQMIIAVASLVTAIAVLVNAIGKGVSSVVRARADFVRAKSELTRAQLEAGEHDPRS